MLNYLDTGLVSGLNNVGSGGVVGTWTKNNTVLETQAATVYYKAEDTSDSIGSNTLTNNGSVGFASALNNNGFVFDGSAKYMSASNADAFKFRTNDFTIRIPIKFNTRKTYNDAIVFNDYTDGFLYQYTYNNPTFRHEFYINGTNINVDEVLGVDDFNQIVISRISGVVYIYNNGVLKGSGALAGDINPASGDLRIGSGNLVAGAEINGLMDEIGIWNGYGATQEYVTALQDAFLV